MMRAEQLEAPDLATIPIVCRRMVAFGGILGLMFSLAACEISTDPETGRRTFDTVLPGTEANAERREAEWQECLETRSPTVCHRQLGPRPQLTPSE